MSVASGYVHISVRNAAKALARNNNQGAVARPNYPANPAHLPASPYRREVDSATARTRQQPVESAHPMTAPTPVIAGGERLQSVSADNLARGFVLYVGVDEDTAAANGTSLAKLAQDIRAYAQALVPQAQSYAAVAIAPADAVGTALDVVRSTFGDPTVANRPRQQEVSRPVAPIEQRPSGVLIDLARREVHLDGETLNLTFKEFELLNYLVENGTRTVARDELLLGLWSNADEVPNERTIDVHIRRLRSKLGRLANTVRTVRGEGYRFYEHPEVVVWAAPEYSI